MTFDVASVKSRLESLGYTVREVDEASLTFCVDKVRSTIKNEINWQDVPEGLVHVAIDMACGEFLQGLMTFSPDALSMFDLGAVVKRIQTGDETTEFAVGSGSMTDEQKLTAFVNYLQNYGRDEFNSFRRLRW